MISTATALFVTNGLILQKSGRLWIYPSQAKQLELLKKRHGRKIADRTLRWHHLNFKTEGKTFRKRRWERNPDGTVFMQTTGMCYTIAGYRDLANLGLLWAKDRIRQLIQKYGPESDSAKIPLKKITPEAAATSTEEAAEQPELDEEIRRKMGITRPSPLLKTPKT